MWSAIKSTKICPSHLAINGTIPFHPCVFIQDGNPFRLQMQPTLRLVYLSLTRNPRTWMRELWSWSSSAISWLVLKDLTRSEDQLSNSLMTHLLSPTSKAVQSRLLSPLLLTERVYFSSTLDPSAFNRSPRSTKGGTNFASKYPYSSSIVTILLICLTIERNRVHIHHGLPHKSLL